MKLLVLTLLAAIATGNCVEHDDDKVNGNISAQDCPNYPPWRDWTDTCLWLPLKEMHEKTMAACGISLNLDAMPPVPELEGLPTAPCGHCSLKLRCRTRPEAEGCL